jgi:sec-independent protein translocase protein TatC
LLLDGIRQVAKERRILGVMQPLVVGSKPLLVGEPRLVALDFLIGYSKDFKPMILASTYTSLFLTIILGLALIFELPIVLGFAGLMGVVNAKFLIKHIRGAVLIFFIIAAVLTPTTDIMNMTIYAAPMILLYLMSIGIVWFVHPRQRRKRAEKQGRV